MAKIGIIGGSGLYDIEELQQKKWVTLKTPFGRPSDEYLLATLDKKEVVFLPRHGRGHRLLPSEINYRANIYGMKSLGVEKIISVTACGSLKEEITPLDFVIPDQFVDKTHQARKSTFFGDGLAVHVGFAHPVCGSLAGILHTQVRQLGMNVHFGGVYLNMEGPQFSTLAESKLYRSWGFDVIGMTNMTEARLAREAEMCYVTLAAVTDYDCWHEQEESVTVDMILANLKENVKNSKKILLSVVSALPEEEPCSCQDALKHAMVTDLKLISRELKDKLGVLLKKYL